MSALDSSSTKQEQENTHKNNSHYKAHNSLASLSLVPRQRKQSATTGQTLLDIIKYEEPKQGAGYKEIIGHKKSWKSFRDKLRLKRAGAAWTSALRVPASDINLHYQRNNNNNIGTHRNIVRFNLPESSAQEITQPDDDESTGPKPLLRRISSWIGPGFQPDENDNVPQSGAVQEFRSGISRHNSIRMPSSEEGGRHGDSGWRASTALGEERQLSAREAAAAQEAAEAATMEEENDSGGGGDEEEQPMQMSLMDLMGSGYLMGEDDDEDYEDEEEESPMVGEDVGSVEHTCYVCMVKHKGAPSTPCGHTFCRMCSRELMVQKGNCPICNKFIVEFLDIF